MIGAHQIQLGANELMSGMASSDYATDGALGVASSGINPFVTPGVIRATASAVDKSSGLSSKSIIATSGDGTSTFAKLGVDAGGKIYSISTAGVLNNILSGAATTKYVFGTTDMVAWNAFSFVSLKDDVAKITASGSPALDETWFTTTLSGSNTLTSTVPHPMVVFNGLLWIGNGNKMVSVTTGGVVTPSALLLDTTDTIQAVHIDPATGYMMVSAARVNTNHAIQTYVYIFDAFSTLPRRAVPAIDDLITGFHSVNGTVYVGCANRLYVWNGNGVTFLRTLKNAAAGTSDDYLWKHHMTSYGNVLYYADGKVLMAYGEPIGLQRKGFFPVSGNPADSSHLGAISLLTSGVIGFGWITSTTPKWYAVDMTSTSAGSGILSFNNIYFPRPLFVRRMRIITDGITTTAGIGDTAILDEATVSHQTEVHKFVVLAAATPKYMFDFDYSQLKLQAAQPQITLDTQGFAVARVIIFYDPAE